MARTLQRLISQTLLHQHHAVGSVRLYARWMTRNPAKVLLPFETVKKSDLKKEKVIDLGPQILNKSKKGICNENHLPDKENEHDTAVERKGTSTSFSRQKAKEIKAKRDEAIKKRHFYLNQKKVFDDNNELIYEKLKEKDSRIRYVP